MRKKNKAIGDALVNETVEVEVLKMGYTRYEQPLPHVIINNGAFQGINFDPASPLCTVYFEYDIAGEVEAVPCVLSEDVQQPMAVTVNLAIATHAVLGHVRDNGFSLSFRTRVPKNYADLADSVSILLYGHGRRNDWQSIPPSTFIPHVTKQMLDMGNQYVEYQQAETKASVDASSLFYDLASVLDRRIFVKDDYVNTYESKSDYIDAVDTALLEAKAQSDLADESRDKCWKQNQITIATLEVALAQTKLTLAQTTLDKLKEDQ